MIPNFPMLAWVLVLALACVARGQGLGAVLSSVQERHKMVSAFPVVWEGVPNDPQGPVEFPSEASVQSLGIETKIHLLAQAAAVFRSTYPRYLNVRPEDLSAGAGTGVASLDSFSGVQFPPYGPIEPATYRTVLRQLAMDVTRLRVLPAPSVDCEATVTTDFYRVAEEWELQDEEEVRVARDFDGNVVSSPVWFPEALEIGSNGSSSEPGPSSTVADFIRVEASYSEFHDTFHPPGEFPPVRTSSWEIHSHQLTALGADGPNYWPGGTAHVLGRVAWNPWTGVPPLDNDDGAWRVIGSAAPGALVELTPSDAPVAVEGGWTAPASAAMGFIPDGFTFAKDSGGGPVGFDWKRGSPGDITVYQRDYVCLLVPVFGQGLDVAAAKAALAKLRKVTPRAAVDGRALPRPIPGMVTGIHLGPGTEDGTADAWLGVVPAMAGHWFGEGTLYQFGLGFSALPSAWNGWRFDCAPALRFIGPHADYHVVYQTTRDPEVRAWELPPCDFGDGGFRQRGWDGRDAYFDAWDSPRLRQVVGRHVVVDIEQIDGFSQSVRVYRRDGSAPDLDPGDLVDISGLPLLRELTIGNPASPETMTEFGSGAERVAVIDPTAGTTLNLALGSINHYWGDWEFTLSKSSDQSELWKEVWDSDSTAATVGQLGSAPSSEPEYTVATVRDGNLQTAVVAGGLPGPCHFRREAPASVAAGGTTATSLLVEASTGGVTTVTRTTTVTGEATRIEVWRDISRAGDDPGSPPRIPLSASRGGWKTEFDLAAGSRILEIRALLGSDRTGTDWIEWTDNGATGDSVTLHSAPDGDVTAMGHDSVAATRYDFGGMNNGAGSLPWALLRTDNGDGGGTLLTYNLTPAGGLEATADAGRFAAGGQSAIDRGGRGILVTDAAGYPVTSSSAILGGPAPLVTGSAAWDPATRTAWGEPTRVTRQPGGLVEQWSYNAGQNGGETDNLHVRSHSSPLGLDVEFDPPDPLGRVNGGEWNGIPFGVSRQPGDTGADLTFGSGADQVVTSWRADLLGRFLSNGRVAGGRTATGSVQRDAAGATSLEIADGFGGGASIATTPDGSLDLAEGSAFPFGGTQGGEFAVEDGLLKTRTEFKDQANSYLAVWTDAWGRVRKSESPSKSGSGAASTPVARSDPDSPLKRVVTVEPSGRVLITESEPYAEVGAVTRTGIDVDFTSVATANLGAADRYTESVTKVENGKVVTTLSITDEAGTGVIDGLREILSTEWTPATGVAVTQVNGNEETLTSTPNYTTKTLTTASTKGWSTVETLNKLGLPSGNTLSGTGIPTTELNPVWRADGSLASVDLEIAGETHSAGFNLDGTLSSLVVPGRGNILGGHEIEDGVETLTVDGVTVARKLDGTEIDTSGGDVTGKNEKLTLSGNGYKFTVDPAEGASTDTVLNAAGAATAKNYAAGPGETYGYADELLASVTLARGEDLLLGYSPDGAKDLVSAVWPAVTSGDGPTAFLIPAVSHGFGYDRAGRINAIGDAAGVRSLAYDKGRLVSSVYNAGPLKGYEIIRHRDTTGRDTGFTLNRDGAAIHTSQKTPNGASDQISALASGDLKIVPQRDAAGRITGFQWGNATGTFVPAVTQTWQRGAGGRIEEASSDVTGAPSFNYAPDSSSFDTRGRRLKCATAGGTWTYEYTNGRLTKATHASLGIFNYSFDGIGRRLGKDPVGTDLNTTDLLNRTLAWTHSQSKNVKISAHPDARVWINGTEVPSFTGQHSYAITPPGANGGWVEWEALAILEGQGEGAGSPAPNPLASPDAKSLKKGAVWVPPLSESFTFDDAGNRESSAQWDYGWDAKNQLVRARTKNCIATSETTAAPQGWDLMFSYDSEGRRFKKHVVEYRDGERVSEKNVTFVWDGWDLIYERHQLPSGLTTLERKYLWGPDIADGAAGGAGGLLLIRETKGDANQDIYPLYDGTGHVVALTNSNGTLLASYAYGPFGELIHATGPAAQANPWRYATKYRDEETGLTYFGHRYHDPVTGQWLSREPLGESESVNLYEYCHSDPVNKLDVFGLAEININQADPTLIELALKLGLLTGEEGADATIDIGELNSRLIGSGRSPIEFILGHTMEPCMVCHGRSAGLRLAGVGTLYSLVSGQVHSSDTSGDMMRKVGAGAWGNVRALPGDVGNLIAFFANGSMNAVGELAGSQIGDHPAFYQVPFDAEGWRIAGQQRVYPGISSDNLLVGAGGALADTLFFVAGPETILKGGSLFSRASGWSVRIAPRFNPLNYRVPMGELYSGMPRLKYVGRTPGKASATGREVIERMRAEGAIMESLALGTLFKGSDGTWYPLRFADMSHKLDAVHWWNSIGRFHGPKSPEVRRWMLDPDNYLLDYFRINRSGGGSLKNEGVRYIDPQ
jgi:RHS repeat-associated protein